MQRSSVYSLFYPHRVAKIVKFWGLYPLVLGTSTDGKQFPDGIFAACRLICHRRRRLTSSVIDTLQDSDLHGKADQSPELPPQRARHHLHFYCLDFVS